MKDLIEKIFRYIPEYLLALGRLLARPKTFLATTQPDTDEGFRNGLQFLAVSIALVILALTPLIKDGSDIWKQLAINSLCVLLGVAATASIARLAWHIVGGRASTKSLFTLNSYIASVLNLLAAVTLIIAFGALRVFNPGLPAALAAAGVLVCGLIVIQVWYIASWGAFRAINQASRGRSLAAFALANVLALPVSFVAYLIVKAMSP
jgi:hypothetical protein